MVVVVDSCDASTILGLIGMAILGLVVGFTGHRLYRSFLSFLGFAFLCAVQAKTGVDWLEQAPDEKETEKKIILVVCCVAWGALGAFICRRFAGTVQQYLGILLGALFGVVVVYGVIFAVKADLDAVFGPGYKGWDMFALSTLGLPAAILSGYLLRNTFKYALMLATAVGGALIGVQSLMALFGCAEADLGPVYEEKYQALIIVIFAVLGFLVQYCTDPEKRRTAEPRAPCENV